MKKKEEEEEKRKKINRAMFQMSQAVAKSLDNFFSQPKIFEMEHLHKWWWWKFEGSSCQEISAETSHQHRSVSVDVEYLNSFFFLSGFIPSRYVWPRRSSQYLSNHHKFLVFHVYPWILRTKTTTYNTFPRFDLRFCTETFPDFSPLFLFVDFVSIKKENHQDDQ